MKNNEYIVKHKHRRLSVPTFHQLYSPNEESHFNKNEEFNLIKNNKSKYKRLAMSSLSIRG